MAELAEVLTGRHEEREVSDEAWARVCADNEQKLRTAVSSGTLVGRGAVTDVCVQEGPFNAWAGLRTAPVPDYLLSYRVIPDGEAGSLPAERAGLKHFGELVGWSSRSEHGPNVLVDPLRVTVAASFAELWQVIKAVEVVVAAITEEFEGVDPLLPSKRAALDAMRATLHGLTEPLTSVEVVVNQPEPTDDQLRMVGRIVWSDA